MITYNSTSKTLTDLSKLPTNKSELLLINCKSSGRSTSAAKILEDMGYTNVKNMAGGLNEWIKVGYFRDIPATTFKTKVTSDVPYTLLDVRAQSEFDTGYLHGATLIPYTDILLHTDLLPENQSELILVYCKSGGRGSIASQSLEDLGYTNVINMGGGITSWKANGYYTDVPSVTFKSVIDSNKYDLLVDVRSQAEWDTGYIQGAIRIQHDEILLHTDQLPENMSAVILIYCKSGGRGSIASQTLEGLGYTNVINLGGGITAWNASGYAIAGIQNTDTNTSTSNSSNSVDGFGIVAFLLSSIMIATIIRKRK